MSGKTIRSLVKSWETVRFELLKTSISAFDLAIEGSPLERFVDRLRREMEAKGFRFKPEVYLTDIWGCPDRTPVIGVPFYLADPRLVPPRGGAGRRSRGPADDHDAPPPRGRTRRELRLPSLAPAELGGDLRPVHQALPGRLPPRPGQPALRAPHRRLSLRPDLRPEAPRRGLRRDLRRLADAPLRLARTIQELARHPQAPLRRPADEGHPRLRAGKPPAAGTSGPWTA